VLFCPLETSLDFAGVFDRVATLLEREGLPVAVVGAFALHAYGLSRATSDLDLVTDAAAQPKLLPFLAALGYETLHASRGYSNHLHADPDLGRLDVVYIEGATSRALFAGCRPLLALGGPAVPVPRPEHLAAMKVQAIKNDPTRTLQDLADVRFLLTLPGIDAGEVRGYFEKAGLLDRYDEIRRTL
jgi:hypothetical protein